MSRSDLVIDEAMRLLHIRRGELEQELSAIDAAIAAVANTVATPQTQRTRNGRKPGPKKGAARAPRGENRRRILDVIAKSELTVSEIVAATRIAKPTVASTMSQLLARGFVTRNANRKYKAVAPKSTGAAGRRADKRTR
jgi:hypothetical protein